MKSPSSFRFRRKGRAFTVYLDIPERASEEDVMDYIADAVKTWRGQLFPGSYSTYGDDPEITGLPNTTDDDRDPMWDLDPSTVRVGLGKEIRRYRRGRKWTRVGLTPPHLRNLKPSEE